MGILKTAFSFAKGSPYKLAAIVIIVLAITTGIYYSGKTSGYNKAKAEELQAVKDAEKALAKKYNLILAKQDRAQQRALRLIERLRNRPRVTHNEIKQAANASECKHLGLEFNRVFNKLVDPPGTDRPK
jgi:uncharacterized protein HemX